MVTVHFRTRKPNLGQRDQPLKHIPQNQLRLKSAGFGLINATLNHLAGEDIRKESQLEKVTHVHRQFH